MRRIRLSANKSMLGHMLGGADEMEAIALEKYLLRRNYSTDD
ncbi:hypothetical protein [Exiguobacterium sp. R-39]